MSPPASTSPSSTFSNTRTIAAKPASIFDANIPGLSPYTNSPYTNSPYANTISTMAGPRPVGDSNGGVQVSVSNADNSSVGSSGRSFVTQQFSAATEAILKRIRGEGGYLTPGTAHTLVQPPGYENVRRSVLEGMKTTLNMDVGTSIAGDQTKRTSSAGYQRMPTKPRLSKSVTSGTSTPPSTGAAAKPRSGTKTVKNKAGSKRKRIKEESDSAEESAAMSGLGGDSDSDSSGSVKQFPTQTLSGRKVVKPAQFNPAAVEGPARKRASHNYKRNGRSVEQALCKRCGRGHSPASNMIVFCDGCNIGWHQMCHDPIVPDETVKDETKEWFCNECGSKKAKSRGTSTPSAPAKVQTWQERSMEEKRTYLSSLPPSHVVSLLLHATTLHPDIPIWEPKTTAFQQYTQHSGPSSRPVERRVTVYPQQPFPPSATAAAGLFTRAEANPNAPINFIRKLQSGSPVSTSSSFTSSFDHNPTGSQAKTNEAFQHASSAPPALPEPQVLLGTLEQQEDNDESRESTPASPPYPKPGNGLMARLPPDDQDLEWLVGEGEDEAAFSHMLFDDHGRTEMVKENGVSLGKMT